MRLWPDVVQKICICVILLSSKPTFGPEVGLCGDDIDLRTHAQAVDIVPQEAVCIFAGGKDLALKRPALMPSMLFCARSGSTGCGSSGECKRESLC